MIKDCIELNLDWHYNAESGILKADVLLIGDDDNEEIGKIVITKRGTNLNKYALVTGGPELARNAVLCNHRTVIDTLIKEMDEIDIINSNSDNKDDDTITIDKKSSETNVVVEINLKEAIEELKKEL